MLAGKWANHNTTIEFDFGPDQTFHFYSYLRDEKIYFVSCDSYSTCTFNQVFIMSYR